jgi:hypothetical protein
MKSGQFENGQIMVIRSWFPTGSGVAGTAVDAKATLVNVLDCVAGITVLWSCLENCHCARVDMALCALHLCMGSGQLKCNIVMVEIMSVAVNSIMACQAIRAEIEHMTR